jgi:CHAT domain-containing protein
MYADRARLLLRTGRDTEAVDALEALATQGRAPERAITVLDGLLARRPGDPHVLRARGIANFRAGHGQAARADLKAAVDGGKSDWRTYLMLGVSLILPSPADDQQTGLSIREALEALAQAVLRSADTDDEDAADAPRALRWLADRAFGDLAWLNLVAAMVESGVEPSWCSALPGLTPALLMREEAYRVEKTRDFQAAAAAWEQTQALFTDADLPATAARTSINIADARLRLYDLDAVAAHLENAEAFIPLMKRPLMAGRFEIEFKIDYLNAEGIGIKQYENQMRSIETQLAARAGDYAAATASIGDGEWLFAEPGTADLAAGVTVSMVVSIAQILRDADKPSQAVALLSRVASGSEENLTAGVWATLATLATHDLQAQITCLDFAERHADGNPALLQALTFMRAEAYAVHRRWDEALALLDEAEGQPFSRPHRIAFRGDLVRAQAELDRGNAAQAVELADRAINGIEQTRLELTRWELREAWSGTAVRPYLVAIRAAMAAGRPRLAFEYAERARARAFLDDVSLAGADVEGLTRQMRQTRDDIAWLERLTMALSPVQMTRLQELVRRYLPDLPHEPSMESVVRAGIALVLTLQQEQIDLERRLDVAKVKALRRQGHAPATWQQIRAAIGAAHLAQYHCLDDQVLLFVGTGDEPEIVEVPVGLSEIDSALAPGEIPGGGFDLRHVDLRRLQAVAGPLVAPLASRVPPGELVCLIPHDRLHAIPLHMLEVDDEPLGIRNPVSYWPSASILVNHLSGDTAAPSDQVLVVGDPEEDLDYARVEALTVARQLTVTPVLGRQVSKQLVLGTLLDQDSPPGLVHVAAHGTMDTGGAGAGIVLGHAPHGSKHWLRDDVLTTNDLAGMKLPAALVVLSCCRAAGGTVRPGGELAGLVRALLAAGAGAVVLSQWSVDDLSTSVLMRELYRLLTSKQAAENWPLADALRQAASRVRSMTRDEVTAAIREGLAEAIKDVRTARTVRVDSAALASAEAFAPMRAALAVSRDKWLRDAALEAEARRGELWAADSDQYPFRHPHYWAPFVLVGDWRLHPRQSGSC